MTTNHKPHHIRILGILQSSYAHQIDRIMSLQKKLMICTSLSSKIFCKQTTCPSFMVGRSLNPSMQEPTNLPPLKLAQLLFLLILIQASDHSRENNLMKRNSWIFYFQILIKSTHTQWAFQQQQKLLFPQPLNFLFPLSNHTCEISPKILLLSSSHGLLIIHWSKSTLRIKLELRLKG
jgi:hypothetical protein